MRAEHEIYTKTAAKALEINLNPQHYGVLAEIGAVGGFHLRKEHTLQDRRCIVTRRQA